MQSTRLITAAVIVQGLIFSSLACADDRSSFFSAKVAPILQKRCVQCHDPRKAKGGLDLTSRKGLREGGDSGDVVVPGKPDKSLLIQMIAGPKPKMPRAGKPLTRAEVFAIREWIEKGAAWPQSVTLAARRAPDAKSVWWSLRPLTRPAQPPVQDARWVRTPVDAFVLAGLEARGLKPSVPASRTTLIRRLTYDLWGLPPTPAEIDAFVSDSEPSAYERLVDRLLASPHYGERWARHWLDVVHYADTHGYDKDKRRDHAWHYRDYVIRAFNEDKKYADFIREQLAGDVLRPHDPDGIVATGFIVAGPWDFVGHVELREGTVDKKKTRLLDRDDMVATTISTFVSMTAHCARCHDHKFDPIPQRDYYRLQAVFAGVERGDRPLASRDFVARRTELERKRHGLVLREAALLQKIKKLTSPGLAQLEAELSLLQKERATLPRHAGRPSPSNGYHSAIEPKAGATKWAQVDLGKTMRIAEIRLIPARPTDFPDTPGFGFPVRFRVEISQDPSFLKPEIVSDHTAGDFSNPGDVPVVIRLSKRSGRYVRVTATRLWKRLNDYVFALAEMQVESSGKNVAAGARVTALDSIEAGRWSRKNLVDGFDSRTSLPDLTDPRAAAAYKRSLSLDERIRQKHCARETALEALIPSADRADLAAIRGEKALLAQQAQKLGMQDMVYAALPQAPRPIHRLHRGDVEEPRELVTPGALSALSDLDANFAGADDRNEGLRRLALASWIASSKNPLTWRSIANRIWHYHFGRGIVDTPNDFGRNGSRSTHPELLDWLAVEMRDGNQSFKKLHRLILLSATYRQASAGNAAYARIDAGNRFLWRMNRRRLDAESIRDTVLALSGKLNFRMGGPGFELFRFKDDHSPTYDHSAVDKINDPAGWRRTVYRFTVRSVPNPFLECLDCADPNINTPVRNTTLTALQALALLNDPFMVKQAELFAERLKNQGVDSARQVETAYRLAFGRPPSAAERQGLAKYAERHGMPNACRLLLNANELMFID